MSLFDLLFLALLFSAVASLTAAGWFALAGKREASLRIMRRLAAGAAIYFSVVILVSLFASRRVYSLGEAQCSDDWCITADTFNVTTAGTNAIYDVAMHVSSRALRVSQREQNLAVYLVDQGERRYPPVKDASDVPFNVLLSPGDSVAVKRRFIAPASVHGLNLEIRREGGFPISWFIIGYDSWFRKSPIVMLRAQQKPRPISQPVSQHPSQP